ncbi:MAG: Triosephosphate isomerase [Bacteroidota bacterium]
MRTAVVAANWKMNNDLNEAKELVHSLLAGYSPSAVEVYIAPPFVHLQSVHTMIATSGLQLAAQNMNAAASGAHTGEISSAMLKSVGASTVILGHSERRDLYGETDAQINAKVKSALSAEMKVIFCFGEQLGERKAAAHFDVVKSQLSEGLSGLSLNQMSSVILAYEPVWAIGTGETASPEQAQEMHAFIRDFLRTRFSEEIAEHTRILYGGSVKPSNAAELFAKPDIDGGLIGGASLQANDFLAIVKAAS